MGYKPSSNEPFKWIKYSEVNEMAEAIGSAFITFGLEPAKQTFIGIFAKNRTEVIFKLIIYHNYIFTKNSKLLVDYN